MVLLTTESAGNIQEIEKTAEIINRYGFLIVFGAVVLVVIFVAVMILIKRWDSNTRTKTELENKKSMAEIDLMQKQRMKEIEQNSKMFTLVTEVQTNQISQLQSITEVINLMKQEIQQNTRSTASTSTIVNVLCGDINKMIDTYSNVELKLNQIYDYIKEKKEVDEDLIDKLDELKKQLEEKLK